MNVPPGTPDPFGVPPTQAKPPRSPAFWIIGSLVLGMCCVGVPIIAAILFPVFAQARESAKRTQSLQNVKTLGTAVLIYTTSYDDIYPPAEQWQTAITPILSEPKALVAPPANQPVAYAFSAALSKADSTTLQMSNRTPMIFESNVAGPNAFGSQLSVYVRSKKVIVGFADSSAKAVDEDEVASLDWTPPVRRVP